MKRKFVDVIKQPPVWLIVVTYIVAMVSIPASIILSVIAFDGIWLQILTYVAYVLAVISLGYAVYTLVYLAPRAKKKFLQWADKREYTRQIVSNYGVRTVVFAVISFALSLAYGAYNFTLAILGMSIWYGVLAAYYILLACMRGGVITHHRKRFRAYRRGKSIENVKIKGIKRYRNCGIMLIIMTFALSIAVLQMISAHNTFEHAGLMIYVAAAYTFYKVTMSIINIVKAKKQNDITVQAIRNINLADAAVSLLALQTSMVHAFGAADGLKFSDTLNGVTGAVVCALVFALGIYMIIKAQKAIKVERNNVDEPTEESDESQDNSVEGE